MKASDVLKLSKMAPRGLTQRGLPWGWGRSRGRSRGGHVQVQAGGLIYHSGAGTGTKAMAKRVTATHARSNLQGHQSSTPIALRLLTP